MENQHNDKQQTLKAAKKYSPNAKFVPMHKALTMQQNFNKKFKNFRILSHYEL